MDNFFKPGEFWVLCNKRGNGFLDVEGESFTGQLERAMKFPSYEVASEHRDKMVEIHKKDMEEWDSDRNAIYLHTTPGKITIVLELTKES